MSSSDSSSEESDISEQEYSEEDSSSSSSDDSSSDDSDDENFRTIRKRQLRRRVRETREKAEQKIRIEESQLLMDNTFGVLGSSQRLATDISKAEADIKAAEAEAKEAAEALAREEEKAKEMAQQKKMQKALLTAMMAARMQMLKLYKKIQGNITKLKKNKPETENLIMAPTLLWTCQPNGLAKRPTLDLLLDTAIKSSIGCIKFDDIKELGKVFQNGQRKSARFMNDVMKKGSVFDQVEKTIEITRKMNNFEKAKQLGKHAGKELGKKSGGKLGSAAKIASLMSTGHCDIPMIFVRTLFGKYPEECDQNEDIAYFFKYPNRAPFDSIASANSFYGKTSIQRNANVLIPGGKFKPPSKEMESALKRRRIKRKSDNETKKKLISFDVFSNEAGSHYEKRNLSLKDVTDTMTNPKTIKNIGYWLRGTFKEKADDLVNMLPSTFKYWGAGLKAFAPGEPVPYCPTGCLTDPLGFWVRKLNINLNFGPNYTYDHFGCIFSIDFEGDKELEPYHKQNSMKYYLEEHLDKRYGKPLTQHSTHTNHVPFQLRRMYQKAIDSGFKPKLTYSSKIIVEDELLNAYCGCFQDWKEDMAIQTENLENLTKALAMNQMLILKQKEQMRLADNTKK